MLISIHHMVEFVALQVTADLLLAKPIYHEQDTAVQTLFRTLLTISHVWKKPSLVRTQA